MRLLAARGPGRPLGGGSGRCRQKGPAETCVRKGAPTRLPGRPRGWAAGGARPGGREGARGRAGAGGQASRSGLRTAGGAWNLTDPARPATPPPCHPGKGLRGPARSRGLRPPAMAALGTCGEGPGPTRPPYNHPWSASRVLGGRLGSTQHTLRTPRRPCRPRTRLCRDHWLPGLCYEASLPLSMVCAWTVGFL